METCIFNIQRFSTKDGPGIRTTVFFQGCNLRCAWCHNPESIPASPKLQFFEDKCVSCGLCVKACSMGAHFMDQGKHRFDEGLCAYLGDCAQCCPQSALKADARQYTPEALRDILVRDKAYYLNSGGGVTASGGEPMLDASFVRALFSLLRSEGIHTALDSAACVAWKEFEKVLPFTDLFLIDLKAIDEDTHIQYTGAGNLLILDNIRALSALGARMEIRMPLVRDINDTPAMAERTGEFLSGLPVPPAVRLLPYHSFGLYKAQSIRQSMQAFSPPVCVDTFAKVLRDYDLEVEV